MMACNPIVSKLGRVYVKSMLFNTDEFLLWGNGMAVSASSDGGEPGFILGANGNPVGFVAGGHKLFSVELVGRLEKDESFLARSSKGDVPIHIQIRYGSGIDSASPYDASSIICIDGALVTSYQMESLSSNTGDSTDLVGHSISLKTTSINVITPKKMFKRSVVSNEMIAAYAAAPLTSDAAGIEIAVALRRIDCVDFRQVYYVRRRGDDTWRSFLDDATTQYVLNQNKARKDIFCTYAGDSSFFVGAPNGANLIYEAQIGDQHGQAANNPLISIDRSLGATLFPTGDPFNPLSALADFYVGWRKLGDGYVGVSQFRKLTQIGVGRDENENLNLRDEYVKVSCIGESSKESSILIATLGRTADDDGHIIEYSPDGLQRRLQRISVARSGGSGGEAVTAIAECNGRIVYGNELGEIWTVPPFARQVYAKPYITAGTFTLSPYIQSIAMLSENIIFASLTKKTDAVFAGDVTNIYAGPAGVVLCSLDGGVTWNVEHSGDSIVGFSKTENGLVGYGSAGWYEKASTADCAGTVGYDYFAGSGVILYPNHSL